jgi:hypothetical protein
MTRRLRLDSKGGPFKLPPVQDFAIVPEPAEVTLAVTVEGDDETPTVVFIQLPRAILGRVITELTAASEHH